jgi:hypothetical protein
MKFHTENAQKNVLSSCDFRKNRHSIKAILWGVNVFLFVLSMLVKFVHPSYITHTNSSLQSFVSEDFNSICIYHPSPQTRRTVSFVTSCPNDPSFPNPCFQPYYSTSLTSCTSINMAVFLPFTFHFTAQYQRNIPNLIQNFCCLRTSG